MEDIVKAAPTATAAVVAVVAVVAAAIEAAAKDKKNVNKQCSYPAEPAGIGRFFSQAVENIQNKADTFCNHMADSCPTSTPYQLAAVAFPVLSLVYFQIVIVHSFWKTICGVEANGPMGGDVSGTPCGNLADNGLEFP